jgi:hypothetical protein
MRTDNVLMSIHPAKFSNEIGSYADLGRWIPLSDGNMSHFAHYLLIPPDRFAKTHN